MSRVLSRALCRAATLSASLTGVTVLAASAVAQQAPASDGAEGQREPAVPVAGNAAGASVEPSEAPLAVASDAEDDAAKYRRFDALAEPGLTTSVPGSADSLLRDAGGVRSMLAEHDIGIQARLSMVGLYNPLDTGQPYAPQRYNGQRPTLQYQATNIVTTIGLDKFGLADAKLILGYNSQITTFRPNGQNTVGFRNIALYQSFADNKIELKLGIMPNYYVGRLLRRREPGAGIGAYRPDPDPGRAQRRSCRDARREPDVPRQAGRLSEAGRATQHGAGGDAVRTRP